MEIHKFCFYSHLILSVTILLESYIYISIFLFLHFHMATFASASLCVLLSLLDSWFRFFFNSQKAFAISSCKKKLAFSIACTRKVFCWSYIKLCVKVNRLSSTSLSFSWSININNYVWTVFIVSFLGPAVLSIFTWKFFYLNFLILFCNVLNSITLGMKR